MSFVLLAAPAPAALATPTASPPTVQEDASESPEATDVLLALRDVDVPIEAVRVRTTLMSDGTASALVELDDGTLVDVQLASTGPAWSVRDIFYVAGDPESYRSWASGWRRRVASAQQFLESQRAAGEGTRRPQELAPLVWFEDREESSRLWGLNPVTYRLMQTLQMMPALSGPMDRGGTENPGRPR